MNKKIYRIMLIFIILITLFFAAALLFLHNEYRAYEREVYGEKAVLINEIKNTENLEDVLIIMDEIYEIPITASNIIRLLLIAYSACVAFVIGVFLLCRNKIIKPFIKLERFASEVAKGNLDFPLEIQRENIFGEFSWAFDFMRSELKTSRENEEAARHENKALIAAISHDIKTPVASIRAYAEALQNNMDTTAKRRERYLEVIIKKSDEVTRLTNDLFLHALSDMEKLQFEIKPYHARDLLDEILDPFIAEYGEKINLVTDIPDVSINTDEKRIAQVFENIISNCIKYAPDSDIDIDFKVEDEALLCKIRDFGKGIPPCDMPFILNRFYRGENSKDISGSGLGFYIVKFIIQKSGGFVQLNNSSNGLEVIFSIPLFI